MLFCSRGGGLWRVSACRDESVRTSVLVGEFWILIAKNEATLACVRFIDLFGFSKSKKHFICQVTARDFLKIANKSGIFGDFTKVLTGH